MTRLPWGKEGTDENVRLGNESPVVVGNDAGPGRRRGIFARGVRQAVRRYLQLHRRFLPRRRGEGLFGEPPLPAARGPAVSGRMGGGKARRNDGDVLSAPQHGGGS